MNDSVSTLNPPGRDWPGQPAFALFGAGPRRKLLYTNGVLFDALSGEVLERFEALAAHYQPDAYRVSLDTPGGTVELFEDETGVWLERGGARDCLTNGGLTPGSLTRDGLTRDGKVNLPSFEGRPHAALLRALHHELLVNLVGGAPLPNIFVYKKPWLRDAAMVGLALEHTGNTGLLREWVQGLSDPFDRNNAGLEEPDNLGQALTLVALAGFDATHPVVAPALAAARAVTRNGCLEGLSDFAPHPVYQTKWMKYGLARLGLDDPYRIPAVYDAYSALFWMDYQDQHVPGPRFPDSLAVPYPYLKWAQAHFYNEPPPFELAGRSSPLTWEAEASQANYAAQSRFFPTLAAEHRAAPHTWHAAEMFLLLASEPAAPRGAPGVTPPEGE